MGLVLSRNEGQKVVLSEEGGSIIATITALEARNGRMRLDFEAPRSVSVDREEVYERVQTEGRRRSVDDP